MKIFDRNLVGSNNYAEVARLRTQAAETRSIADKLSLRSEREKLLASAAGMDASAARLENGSAGKAPSTNLR